MYRGKAGRESEVDGGQKRCKWLGVNDGVVNGRGETSAYGGKGGGVDVNRRVSNRVRGAQGKIKTEGKDELALRFVPQAGLEPAQPQRPRDFKSLVSTIPPSGRAMVSGKPPQR